MMLISYVSLLALAIEAQAGFVKVPRQSTPANPVVALTYGSFRGNSSNGINSFLGVPFAQPPVGPLRYHVPLAALRTSNLIQNATSYGPSCSQQSATAGFEYVGPSATTIGQGIVTQIKQSPLYASQVKDSEDCLSINVIAPAACLSATAACPVLVWVYGGGFEGGTTSGYDGTPIVARSIVTGTPIVYVSMNYRLNGFGFMGGKQIKDGLVGNLGLYDQRLALQWVQTHIAKFGGDSKKVTIWGESAGAISVALQMVTNKGQQGNLFRGAFMNSGSPIPVGPIDSAKSQAVFDFVSDTVGCRDEDKTLACMRLVPYSALKAAIDLTPGFVSYQSLVLSYVPQVDGVFFTDNPQQLVAKNEYSKIPIVTGDCLDEGTFFSITSANTTTDAQALAYIKNNYIPKITDSELAELAGQYPSDPNVGSPYETGLRNQLTPQFKRLASFAGDLVFEAPRRYFLSFVSKTQPSWMFLFKRGTNIPYLGAFHSFDLTYQFYATKNVNFDGIDYLVNFVDHLNPNPRAATTNPNLIFWPKYTVAVKNVLTFLDLPPLGSLLPLSITLDNYRVAPIAFMTKISLKYPL